MRRAFWFVLVLSTLLAGPEASAQERLTIEAIFGDELSVPAPSQIRWTPEGNLSYFLSADDGGRDLWLFDTTTGDKRVLVGAPELVRMAPSPSQATRDERERTRRTRFGVPDYHWSPDGRHLLFASAGKVLLYELEDASTTELAPSKSGVLDPKFSPDGEWIAFVYEHDLWVVPAVGGEERQVTFGGSDAILHGDLDWVYPEELGVRTGYHWSPDSRHIAFLELDETLVPTYPITDLLSRQASVDLQRYPRPGDPNPRVRVGIVGIDDALTAWIDRAAEYIPRIQWVDENTVAIQLLNRGQDRLELIYVDPDTGRSSSVLVETDPHWLNVTDDLTFVRDGGFFLWSSERNGFRHLYLYEAEGEAAGRLVRALTEGEWQVFEIEGVDEDNEWVYFTANKDNPIGRDLYRVAFDGSGLERLTEREGTHSVNLSPKAEAYLDDFSAMSAPGGTTFRDLRSDRELAFHENVSLDGFELVEPERKLLDAPEGAKIGLLLMKPKTIEPDRKYPLVVYVYGMPGVPTIRDAWGGSRYLFHQFLVQEGYVVAQIDDRSAAIWGHQYAVLADHDVGPLAVKDHQVAMEHLTSLPYVDGERTAVWGWSGGGFTTAFHMTHTKLFKVGVAGAPVTDWHLYDSIYTERYMGTPHEDPKAYERTSPIEAAAGYSGRLLLIHGTQDDNVHLQNTVQLAEALIRYRKQFDLMLYPNKTHGIRGQNEVIHLWSMIFDYLEKHL